jgi:uncharacterized membrane protein
MKMDAITYTGSTRWDELVVNRVSVAQPLRWLAKGWADMRAAPGYSLRYGGVIVLISGLLTLASIWTGYRFLVPFLAAGFFLVAPAIGLGLYQISAHLERGEPLSRCNALEAWRRNQAQLSIVSAGFFIIMQLWMAANFVLFALLYDGFSPPLDRFFQAVFLSPEGRNFAIASVLVGFVLAWCAFAISAVSVPMLMDRKVDGFTAVRVSIKVVLQNMAAMTVWAALIVVIVGVGLASFYVGLIVALPLIGHATWHAYRDLVPVAPAIGA